MTGIKNEEEILVEIKDLIKIYHQGSRDSRVETIALRGIDFNILKGEMLAIIGPSGSGKTTLINLLGGLDRPSAGMITYFVWRKDRDGQREGIGLTSLSEKELEEFRTHHVGFIFQQNNLIPSLTAMENVMLPLLFLGIKNPRDRAREMLARVGLEHRLDHRPKQLSGGEKQRVAIATALAPEPLIVLADEPTGELDSQTTKEIMTLFKGLNEDLGMTMVIVTHDLTVARACTRIMALRDGTLASIENEDLFFKVPLVAKTSSLKPLEFKVAVVNQCELKLPSLLLETIKISPGTLVGMKVVGETLIIRPITQEDLFANEGIARVTRQGTVLLQPFALRRLPRDAMELEARIDPTCEEIQVRLK